MFDKILKVSFVSQSNLDSVHCPLVYPVPDYKLCYSVSSSPITYLVAECKDAIHLPLVLAWVECV